MPCAQADIPVSQYPNINSTPHIYLLPHHIDRQIPTVISYVDGDEYYGGQAKAFLVRNPDNTIASFRDFLGQEYATSSPSTPVPLPHQ